MTIRKPDPFAMPSTVQAMLNGPSAVPEGLPTGFGTSQMSAVPGSPMDSIGPSGMIDSTFEMGGQVGPGGMPIRPQGQAGLAPQGGAPQNMSPEMIKLQVQEMFSKNPDVLQTIQKAVMEGLRTGAFSQAELNEMVNMAQLALQNPQMWPQLRQLAIAKGLATEADISPEFDPSLATAVLMAGQAVTQSMGGQDQLAAGQGQAAPSMAKGGALPAETNNPKGEVPITAHEGEYVIPAHVVRAKGTEFFDKMLEQYGPNGKASK